jgi:hypothetical protein
LRLTIRDTPDDPGILTYLYRERDGNLIALDENNRDRSGRVDVALLRETLTEHDLWSHVPLYEPIDDEFAI